MIDSLLSAVSMCFDPLSMLALVCGALFGTIVGALPGMGTAVAITICIPFTLQMSPAQAIALLLGTYSSSIYGGSISAVLLNTPGTPQPARAVTVTRWRAVEEPQRLSAG